MSLAELHVHVASTTKEELLDALLALQKDYTSGESSLMLVQEGDLWKLTVREKYMELVRKITPHTELTKTVMETLAVVAWKQPITQSEVIRIRTNKAYEHIDELEKMGFLIKEKYGRTFLLKLTQKFFDYFDLRDAQAARDLFKHIRDQEGETQKRLEDAPSSTGEKGTKQGAGGDAMAKQEAKEHDEAVATGEEEEEIENPEDREHMVDEEEIDPDEALFVQGYEKDEDETLEQTEESKQKKKKGTEEETTAEESPEKNE
jgi:segregation and condensation protein B